MAKLKISLADGQTMPDDLSAAATEVDGGYELDLDAIADVGKLVEFRENNRNLAHEREQLTEKLAQERARIAELEKQVGDTTKDKDKTKSTLESRLADLEASIAEKDKALGMERQRADRQAVRTALQKSLLEYGADPDAVSDAVDIAAKGWTVKGTRFELRQGDILETSKANPGEPMSVDEFAGEFLQKKRHFLAGSKGDGGGDTTPQRRGGKIVVSRSDSRAVVRHAQDHLDGKVEWVD